MAITYIIFSKTRKKFYIGSSREDSFASRLKAHNTGKVRSTKSGRPWIEITTKLFDNYTNARKKEIFLKSGVGRKWIKENFGYLKQS